MLYIQKYSKSSDPMMSCDVILLGSMISASIANEHMVHYKMAEAQDSSVGGPRMDIDISDVNELTSMGFSKTKITEMMGVSRKTFFNKTAG